MSEILFLAHRIPWPADRGDKIRSHNILRHLAGIAPVHVGAFADDDRDMGFVKNMQPHFVSVHTELRSEPQWRAGLYAITKSQPVSVESFASKTMQAWINDLLATRRISHIFCFSGQMGQYVPADFDGRFVMDFVDVDSAKFETYAKRGNPVMRWINAREGKKLARFEQAIATRADTNLFVSEAEATLFCKRSGLASDKVRAMGNGIDTTHYNPDGEIPVIRKIPKKRLIVFTGQMDYRPNIEAVCDFAVNAMPAIREAHPDAIFAIVGRNPTQAVTALAEHDGVLVTGPVDDVRSWLQAASVVVAPLRIARGIQNKILEAMAMAKPVVASRAAAEGIDAKDGVHFYVAHSVDQEADLVIELLANPACAKLLGKTARRHVEAHYGWAKQLAGLDDILVMKTPLMKAAR